MLLIIANNGFLAIGAKARLSQNPDVRENNMKTLIGILAIIIVSGCAPTATKSPADIYSAHHPFESKHYEMMAPISVEYIEYIAKSHHGSVDAILTGVEKRRNDPKELSYFLEHAKKMNDQALITNIPEWISLRDRLEENDAISCLSNYN